MSVPPVDTQIKKSGGPKFDFQKCRFLEQLKHFLNTPNWMKFEGKCIDHEFPRCVFDESLFTNFRKTLQINDTARILKNPDSKMMNQTYKAVKRFS